MKHGENPQPSIGQTVEQQRLIVLLSRLLISGCVLLMVVAITASLSLILGAAGDSAGATATRVIAWLAGGCLAVNGLVLLAALTIAVVRLLSVAGADAKSGSSEPHSAEGSTPDASVSDGQAN